MNYIIQPVYTFPEWIPTVLVEWKDIAKAFWNVWQDTAVMQELRTREILRLRWLALLVQGCSAGCGGTAGHPLRADALVPSAGGGQRECAVSSGRDSLRHPHAQGD